ncbi:hypothetical protein D3C86_638690 [compost metagenome]
MRWLRSPLPTCRRRLSAVAAACLLRSASSSWAFRRFIALSRLACWLRSVWHSTTTPVGTWVIRIADSVLFTCWPPAPEERKVSTRRSAGLITISSTSSASGMIATVAAEVWIRPCDSVAGTRCTRWVPDSNFSLE